jgi:hypothetical protein
METDRDAEVTAKAIKAADELGWKDVSYPEWFAFVAGFRQGLLSVTDLRSHEPPRNSGEGTAVNGPMPLGEKPEALE